MVLNYRGRACWRRRSICAAVPRWNATSYYCAAEFHAVQSGHNFEFVTNRTDQCPLGMSSPTVGYHHPNRRWVRVGPPFAYRTCGPFSFCDNFLSRVSGMR